ncbi:hypothetical protein [Pedosphaera parvula]|uniref:Lipoprotein n=1 Tax=Pedosphaera parvula (strain Ellin514) TaxID=320771 RepID=B9XC06_PEDPL|nr:hypothetical protein [Pedosphaera parvula]EEF62474.1 hypothetical protein Cflav_PD5109 [Pedosphaera parvula Ellin514]
MKGWGVITCGLICSLLLVGCKHEVLPAIRDGAILRKDCLHLCTQLPNGYVPSQDWPESIRRLCPAQVVRSSNVIEIVVHQSETELSGYVVLEGDQTAPLIQYSSIKPTGLDGIYEFELPFTSNF